MRPATSKSYSTSRTRHHMQTKWKSRASGIIHSGQAPPPHPDAYSAQQTEPFKDTFKKMSGVEIGGEEEEGVSREYENGKYFYKLRVNQPSLKKRTIYQKCYKPRKTQPGLVVYAKEYGRFRGPNLDMHTTYSQGFTGNEGDKVERPKPTDTLAHEGPAPLLTSYSEQFPGHKGDNQYVKPTDRHTRGKIPFRSKSTYSRTYTEPRQSYSNYSYIKDQLRTGKHWYGRVTTYSGVYDQPNPEYMAKPVRMTEQKEQNPDYSRQYETTYGSDFVAKPQAVCPAKAWLETGARGRFSESKEQFGRSSRLKSLHPQIPSTDLNKY